MKKLIKGLTYSYNRNIGWQDRTIRTIVGITALIGAIYCYKTNFIYTLICGILAGAQFFTVLSTRCIICYFSGICTITNKEKQALESKGIPFEK